MTEKAHPTAKVARPSIYFDGPQDVVADPALSKDQKAEALATLEQDARQISEAAAEGMTGGEPNRLHDVLTAKNTLAHGPVSEAYGRVIDDLRARELQAAGAVQRALLRQTIASLEGLAAA
jgi:hypothetical protein